MGNGQIAVAVVAISILLAILACDLSPAKEAAEDAASEAVDEAKDEAEQQAEEAGQEVQEQAEEAVREQVDNAKDEADSQLEQVIADARHYVDETVDGLGGLGVVAPAAFGTLAATGFLLAVLSKLGAPLLVRAPVAIAIAAVAFTAGVQVLQNNDQVLEDIGDAVANLVDQGSSNATGCEHIVQSGETLHRIGQVYGITANTLAELNDIADPDRIYVGQRLSLPPIACSQSTVETPVAMRKVVVLIHGACTAVDDSTSVQSDTFDDLRQALQNTEYGYSEEDFLLYSYAGGFMEEDENELWKWHNNLDDELLPITQSFRTTSVDMLHSQLVAYKGRYPDATFVLVGHSLGGVVAMEEVIQYIDTDEYETGFISTVITIDSPLHGVPETFGWLPDLGLLQCVTEGDAFVELNALESIEEEYRNYLSRAISRTQDKDVVVITVGNYSDCVLAPQVCIRDLPISGNVKTQFNSAALVKDFDIQPPCVEEIELFSINNVEVNAFTFNNCIQDSHSVLLHDSYAIEVIAQLVGHQTSR